MEDKRVERELRNSKKDKSENLMIVDLLRNDIGRIAQAASVGVSKLFGIESFASVHQMVSTVCGKKLPNASPIDCIRAAFPGGSMTGAPKVLSWTR